MTAADGRILARGMTVAVKEVGEATRTMAIEWIALKQLKRIMLVSVANQHLLLWMERQSRSLCISKVFKSL